MHRRLAAFTLIELSIVLLVLALLAGAALRYANALNESNMLATTNATLDAVETALSNYVNNNGRLPCPADLTQAENTAAFGTETDTNGDGLCTGYNYINSGADPDAADALYDGTTASQVVQGAVPTKTLRLADRFAYDAWGDKIFYAVDKRATGGAAFLNYNVTNSTIGAIVIKKTTADTLTNAITYKGIYALISISSNRHGGFARNLNGTSVRVNTGSTNTDEQTNCHCNSSATASTFTRIFVQKAKTLDSTSFTNNFNDIVRFKLRSNIGYSADSQ